jgi:DNA-3-methyladenine glycosylase
VSWDLARPVEQVAPELLGAVLRHGEVAVRLTEVEAYDGAGDPASHAFRGRTPRNAIMFGPPGHLYVYFSYGMHWAANIICGPEGAAAGVLLRAGEVVEGLEVARSRRGRAADRDLARGPGRLTQTLGIGIAHKGAYLLDGGPVRLEPGKPPESIMTGPRVGVSVEAYRPWRFWVAGSRFVSDYKRSPRAPIMP